MSTIKVDKLQGTSGSATGLTFSGANGTFGGTLAVTGVHTIGTNAVATSDGGAATTSIVQGLAKAWSRFNGTGTAAIDDSFNIASISDTGTGHYALNFTNNMSNDNYAKVEGGGHWSEQSTTDASDAARMRTYSSTPAVADYTNITLATIGDLA